jgi:hypothetical protein
MANTQQSGKTGLGSDHQKTSTAHRGGKDPMPAAQPVEGASGKERREDHTAERIGGGDKALK